MRRSVLRILGLLLFAIVSIPASPQALRPFSIKDEIGLAHFGDPYGAQLDSPILVSPDGSSAAVHTERGLLNENRLEDEMRIYSMDVLRRYANEPEGTAPPRPVWTVRRNTYREGLIISDWRWLRDSSGLAFLLRTKEGHHQVCLADVSSRTLRALTPASQDVSAFDIRDASHLAYAVRSPGPMAEMMKPGKGSAIAGTGLSLFSLTISTDDPNMSDAWNRSELWAVRGGKPFAVQNSATGKAIPIYPSSGGRCWLSLAPDGNSIATVLAVDEVPKEWETKYLPPPQLPAFRLTAGHQNLNAMLGLQFVGVDAVIDLRTSTVTIPTGAPDSTLVGWLALGTMAWSEDSRSAAFMTDRPGAPPCVVAARLPVRSFECVQPVKYYVDEVIRSVRFAPGRPDSVIVDYVVPGGSLKKRTLERSAAGNWALADDSPAPPATAPGVYIDVKEGMNDPPILVVSDSTTRRRRILWDPNPQLKQIKLGEGEVYRWKDGTGREWIGGLYMPVDLVPGRRYPLVIQTHGFSEKQFRPSGLFPTAFAARALAAASVKLLKKALFIYEGTKPALGNLLPKGGSIRIGSGSSDLAEPATTLCKRSPLVRCTSRPPQLARVKLEAAICNTFCG